MRVCAHPLATKTSTVPSVDTVANASPVTVDAVLAELARLLARSAVRDRLQEAIDRKAASP